MAVGEGRRHSPPPSRASALILLKVASRSAPAGTSRLRTASKNICIFSDGTGQGGSTNGGENTNIFRLYDACRDLPRSNQVCFYDPGLGAPGDGMKKWTRWIHDKLSQATGLGITQNIKDCYEALLECYEPGDRIFLFGFSRGAYTVRSLGGVLKLCGVPAHDRTGVSPQTSKDARRELAREAVQTVYQTYGDDEKKQLRLTRDCRQLSQIRMAAN